MSLAFDDQALTDKPLGSTSDEDRMRQVERIRVEIHAHPSDANVAVGREIARVIRDRAAAGKTCVLGLATGSTPVGIYNELVRMHREEGLSLSNVVTFNLDEYFPMQPDELQSYVRFMREHLFDQIDIDPQECAHAGRHDPDRAGSRLLHAVRRGNRQGGRNRSSAPGHRPHGAYRLQRAGLGGTAARD